MATTLPPSTDYTGSTVTQGGKKTFVTSIRTFLADLLGTDSGNKAAARAALGAIDSAGLRNRIINGAMAVDQVNNGASQTFTAGAALAYCVDQWYGYCTGANVTGQRAGGSGGTPYRYQFTGAASVTGIGFGQRIEFLNTSDLVQATATLSVDLANSFLTTITWTAYYALANDNFGTLASPNKTAIATGTFTVNATLARYSAQIAIPLVANAGIEIVLSVGAQTSGTWTIGNVQLESGTQATPFERRPIGLETEMCQRYFEKSPDNNGYVGAGVVTAVNTITCTGPFFKVTKRVAPSIVLRDNTGLAGNMSYTYGSGSGSLASGADRATVNGFGFFTTATTSNTPGLGAFGIGGWDASARL
jgi:hypothetical protein